MVVEFAMWGNSIALRIPRVFAREICATKGAKADLRVENGHLVVAPVDVAPAYHLSELLAGITDRNLHGEISPTVAIGNEFA